MVEAELVEAPSGGREPKTQNGGREIAEAEGEELKPKVKAEDEVEAKVAVEVEVAGQIWHQTTCLEQEKGRRKVELFGKQLR
jgi:hypothetical protein